MISSTNSRVNRQINRADRDQPPGALAVEGGETIGLLRPVGAQDQVQERRFLRRELLLLLLLAQVGVDADEMLSLVLAEVENFEGAVVFSFGLELSLHANHSLTRGVDGELAQIADDPFAAQFLGYGSSSSGAAEKVSNNVAFVGGCFDDAFKKILWFLCGITYFFR